VAEKHYQIMRNWTPVQYFISASTHTHTHARAHTHTHTGYIFYLNSICMENFHVL